jgi:hypothetical protein
VSANNPYSTPSEPFAYPNEPINNLPASTKGKIQDLIKDPEIEAKRRTNHQAAMLMNRNNWKHGKYSTNYPVPDSLVAHLEALESLSLTQTGEAKAAIANLAIGNLKRIARLEYFESIKGVEDASLSRLIKDTALILKYLDSSQPSANIGLQANFQFNVAEAVSSLSEDERTVTRAWIEEKLAKIEADKAKSFQI